MTLVNALNAKVESEINKLTASGAYAGLAPMAI